MSTPFLWGALVFPDDKMRPFFCKNQALFSYFCHLLQKREGAYHSCNIPTLPQYF
jgi:hypothetical protein